MADRMRFAVLGPGGVGGFLAALLSRAGDDVVVLSGDDTSRDIAARGIAVESQIFGSFATPVRASTHLDAEVDAVLVTVKATDLHEALERVPPSVVGEGVVIPFLNGIEHIEALRQVYPPHQVVPATIRIETTRIRPGLIRQISPSARVDIGSAAESVAAHLRATGLDVRTRDDENTMLWEKFVFLAPMALMTTHARANVGVVRTKRRRDLAALVGEVASIARTDGVAIDPAAIMRFIDTVPATMETSMQRDQAAGRPLELDALGGALLRRAAKAGIDMPVTRRLVGEIQARSAASTSA